MKTEFEYLSNALREMIEEGQFSLKEGARLELWLAKAVLLRELDAQKELEAHLDAMNSINDGYGG